MGDTSLLRRLKQRYRRRRLQRLGVSETIARPVTYVGSGSGAWAVCLAGIDEHSVVYSFGVGTDISFDLDLHRLTGAEVHLFDPTPRSIEWMRSQSLPDGVTFHDYGIAAHDGTTVFFPPRRESSSHFSPVKRYRGADHGEGVSARVYRLSTIVERLGHERLALVKMDIEGGEYDVIDDLASNPVAVDQVLVEFHHAYATIPVSRTVDAVACLSRIGLSCFHISDRTYELSFASG